MNVKAKKIKINRAYVIIMKFVYIVHRTQSNPLIILLIHIYIAAYFICTSSAAQLSVRFSVYFIFILSIFVLYLLTIAMFCIFLKHLIFRAIYFTILIIIVLYVIFYHMKCILPCVYKTHCNKSKLIKR